MCKLTLAVLLSREQDKALYDIEKELESGIVPATGYAHSYCRKVNKMIDSGDMCINVTSYRKVYLPTLAKAIQRELASRYCDVLDGKRHESFSEVATTTEEY